MMLVAAMTALFATAQPARLDEGQRYLGYYTSDEVDNSVGLTAAPGKMQAGAYLESADYAQYIGAKVVGMRFAMGSDTKSTGVAVYSVGKQGTYTQLASVTQDNEGPGWHTVMFDEQQQFTIADGWRALVPSYKYTQTKTNSPIAVYSQGPQRDLYIYGKIPQGAGGSGREEWVNMGSSYGAVAIQLIVEAGNAGDNAVTPQSLGTYRTCLGKEKNISVTFTNHGSKLESIDYTITIGDVTGPEQHISLGNAALGNGGEYTTTIAFPAAEKSGTYPVTLTVTKVNGEANQATLTSASGTCVTTAFEFTKNVFVEEMTGTGCGWCPRGIAGMKALKETFGDRFIGVAIHRYNSSSDPMSPREYITLDNLPAGNAPLCIINRMGQSFDPYYGSSNATFGSAYDVAEALEGNADVGVWVTGLWNNDSTEVTATATVYSNINGRYDIAFMLVADGVKGNNAAWWQNNNYAQYSPDDPQIENDEHLTPFCKGGEYGQNPIKDMAFDDVVIASSYNNSGTLATIDDLVEGGSVTSTYTLRMPTKSSLKPYVDKSRVSIVAIVTDTKSGSVLNATKNEHISTATAISNTELQGNATEVARYNAAGQRINAPQKGLNIIKLSDGNTRKIIVR